jgi:hypothetical protein
VNKKGGKSPELGERAEASRLWLTSPRLFAGRQELDRWWRGRGRPTLSGHASSLCVWRHGVGEDGPLPHWWWWGAARIPRRVRVSVGSAAFTYPRQLPDRWVVQFTASLAS